MLGIHGLLLCALCLLPASSAFTVPGIKPLGLPLSPPRLSRRPLQPARHTLAPLLSSSDASEGGSSLKPKPTRKASPEPDGPYDWGKQWYPIFFEESQDDSAPFTFQLLGFNLVFWKDNSMSPPAWRAMSDKCPHRLVPLSEGRVLENGEIECPYHGWTFKGDTGECTSIPHAESGANWSKERSCGVSLPVAVRAGMVFVWPDPLYNPPAFGEKYPRPDESLIHVPEGMDEPGVVFDCAHRDVPYDYSYLLENVLDVSHVSYTHHGTQGNRAMTKPFHFNEIEPLTPSGYVIESTDKDKNPSGRMSVFKAPNYLHHKLNLGSFTVWVVAYCVPIRPGLCRLLAVFPLAGASDKIKFMLGLKPKFLGHMMRNMVLEDDNIFLHVGERTQLAAQGGNQVTQGKASLPVKHAKANYLATEADLPVTLLHRWFEDTLPIPWAPGTNLHPENEVFTREQLNERWHSHTSKCTICLAALKKIQIARLAVAVLGVCVAVVGRFVTDMALGFPENRLASSLLSLAFSGLCALVWAKLGELESRFFVGKYPPKRNIVETQKWIPSFMK